MADQPGSARVEALWESGLQAYEIETGLALARHPLALALALALALDLQTPHSTDDIAILLQRRAQAFDGIQQRDRMMRTINTTVSSLTPLSHAASLVGPVRQKTLRRRSTSLTFCFSDIIPACKGNTGCSRNTTGCPCRSPVPMSKSSDIKFRPGGQRRNNELRRTRRLVRIDRAFRQSSTTRNTTPSYDRIGRGIDQVIRGADLHARSGDPEV
jgi:hypothetical protein